MMKKAKATMNKAHIFKLPGKTMNWHLIITTGAAISYGVVMEYWFNDKTSCKRQAKLDKAVPHNYWF